MSIRSALARAETIQATETPCGQIYALLEEVLAASGLEDDYCQTLVVVLRAAQDSEAAGYPLSLLPLLACESAGGSPCRALPVAAAWRAMHIAAKLLDDVEDGDVARLSPVPTDAPRVINLATGYIALANMALARLAEDSDSLLWFSIQQDFSLAMLQTTEGQHADLSAREECTLKDYLRIAGAKSGRCFSLASRAGARCATSDPGVLFRYNAFGYNMGILLQITDDLEGFHAPCSQSDLLRGGRTLPVVYALSVASPPERLHLEQWLAQAGAGDLEAVKQARQLMIALGTEVYMRAEATRYRCRALAALAATDGDGFLTGPLRGWLARFQSGE